MILSGLLFNFNRLNNIIGDKDQVPIVADLMASRWAYEALTVTQFKDNKYEKKFFKYDKEMSFANWKKDQWESTLETKLSSFYRNHQNQNLNELKQKQTKRDGQIIINEIKKELTYFPESSKTSPEKVLNLLQKIEENQLTKEDYYGLIQYLSETRNHYKNLYKTAENHHEKIITDLLEINDSTRSVLRQLKSEKKISSKEYRNQKRLIAKLKEQKFQLFKTKYNNHSLEDIVTNSNTLKFITEGETSLIQKSDPIFLDPYTNNYLGAHFYAPSKFLGNIKLDTFYANILVIWFMTILLTFSLYYDLLRKLIEGSGLFIKILSNKLSKK